MRVLGEAFTLAKSIDRDLGLVLRTIHASGRSVKAAELRRVGGAFRSLWEYIKKPLRLYGAWGAVKGFKMHLSMAAKAMDVFQLDLRYSINQVRRSDDDPGGDAVKILSEVKKKVAKTARIVRMAQKSLDAIEIN